MNYLQWILEFIIKRGSVVKMCIPDGYGTSAVNSYYLLDFSSSGLNENIGLNAVFEYRYGSHHRCIKIRYSFYDNDGMVKIGEDELCDHSFNNDELNCKLSVTHIDIIKYIQKSFK